MTEPSVLSHVCVAELTQSLEQRINKCKLKRKDFDRYHRRGGSKSKDACAVRFINKTSMPQQKLDFE